MKIPQTTAALVKAIRTLEGQLVVASDVVLAAVSAIDPSALAAKWAALAVTVQLVALIVQRGLIKIKAAPTPVAAVADVAPVVQQVIAAVTPPAA